MHTKNVHETAYATSKLENFHCRFHFTIYTLLALASFYFFSTFAAEAAGILCRDPPKFSRPLHRGPSIGFHETTRNNQPYTLSVWRFVSTDPFQIAELLREAAGTTGTQPRPAIVDLGVR
jgi:hypothetical protein